MTMIAPPPPAATPQALTPGGRTAVRVALVAAATVLTVGCVASLVMVAWGLSNVHVTIDEKTLPGDLRTLVVDTGDIPVTIRPTTEGEPRVSMRIVNSANAGDQSLVVTEGAGETRLSVSGDRPRTMMSWGGTGEITVTLPPAVAQRLSITAQLDDATLRSEADLDSLVVSNIDGDVVLSGTARRVEVHTRDGDVVAHRPLAVRESFLTSSVDGDVHVDFTDTPPRRIETTTRDGDVAISLPEPGPYLVRASGESTWVRVPETSDPARAVAEVTVRTVDGSVELDTRGRR